MIGNTSPLDTTSLLDIVLSLNDSEYFDSDDEVKIIDSNSNDSSYNSPAYLPPSHRLLATSDVSTVPVSQLLSPDPSPSTSSDIHLLTPETTNFRINPLSETAWSDSD